MTGSSRSVSQATDIVFRVVKALEPLMKALPRDSEVPNGEGSVLFGYCIIEDYSFHPHSLTGGKAQKVRYPSSALTFIPQDNGLGLKANRSWLAFSSW